MPQVRLSPRATRFFHRHIAEIAAHNPQAAEKLIRRLGELQTLLGIFPDMTERGLRQGTRKISMPPFILIARRVGEDIEIASIRHARQGDALAPRDMGEPDVP